MIELFFKGPGRMRVLPAFVFAAALTLGGGALGAVFAQSKSSTAKKSTKKAPAKKTTTRRTSRSRGQSAPTADRIKEIQGKLAEAGYYSGQPSGRWDSATTAAMQKFQESQNLKPTGKLDALTLQKLGLGSTVAGLAPPQKTTPSSGSNR